MGLGETIKEIRARDDISTDEKRRHIYNIKGQAHLEALNSLVDNSFTVGDLLITLTKPPIFDGRLLTVWVSAKKKGNNVTFPPDALPFIYVNPPLIHDGIESPLEAAKQMIVDTVLRIS